MNSTEIKSFSATMAKRCKVIIIDGSDLDATQKAVERVHRETFEKLLPKLRDELRPCCLVIRKRGFVVLPFDVGAPGVPWFRQVRGGTMHSFHTRLSREARSRSTLSGSAPHSQPAF